MKVKQQRLSVSRNQDVGWFDIHVHQTTCVGLMESIRQTGDDPANRLDIGNLFEVTAIRPFLRCRWDRTSRLNSIKGFEQMTAASLVEWDAT